MRIDVEFTEPNRPAYEPLKNLLPGQAVRMLYGVLEPRPGLGIVLEGGRVLTFKPLPTGGFTGSISPVGEATGRPLAKGEKVTLTLEGTA